MSITYNISCFCVVIVFTGENEESTEGRTEGRTQGRTSGIRGVTLFFTLLRLAFCHTKGGLSFWQLQAQALLNAVVMRAEYKY